MSKYANLVLGLIATCLFLGMGCMVAAMSGMSWWEILGVKMGLLGRLDSNNDIETRNELLQFTKSSEDLDIMLLLVIIGIAFSFMALVCVLSMCCCQRNPSGWLCGSVLLVIFSFLAAGGGIAACVFEVIRISNNNVFYSYSWGAYCGWVGGALCFVAVLLSTMVFCFKPSKRNSATHGYTNESGPNYPMDNRYNNY